MSAPVKHSGDTPRRGFREERLFPLVGNKLPYQPRPEAIPAVLQLQYAILRDVGRIGNRRPVRICGDRIGVAACLPSRPLPDGRIACCKKRYQGHNCESPFDRSGQVFVEGVGPQFIAHRLRSFDRAICSRSNSIGPRSYRVCG
jgi:hypothetical protein